MKQALKSKKAFTLVELVVVMALMGIIGLAVALIFLSANNTTVMLAEQTDINIKTNYVMQTLQTQLRFAEDLVIGEPADAGTDANKRYLYSEEGKIYIREGKDPARNLFDEGFYGGYNIGMELRAVGKNNNVVLLSVKTESKNDPQVAYSLETELRALNTINVEGTQGSMAAYIWSMP